MTKYIIRRVLQMIPLLFGVTVITFGIMQLAPGNPMDVMMNPLITAPEQLARLEEELGFNQPAHVQYVRWLTQLLKGNLGYSYLDGRPVTTLIGERLPSTLQLTLAALVLAYLIGIPVGIISAIKRYSVIDRILTTLSFAGISVPEFFLCLSLVYLFALKLDIFPTSGYGTVSVKLSGVALWLDRLPYLVLPATALAVPLMAGIVRYTRSSMLDVLGEDYIRTARAKGLSERVVIYRHALRNSLLPVITLLGLQIPVLFGGAFIVEYIFDWPGMGTLGVTSVSNREYSILMAINLISAFLVLFGNLVSDILYAVVDPRIRYN